MPRDRRQKRDLHALDNEGMVLCNPRDKVEIILEFGVTEVDMVMEADTTDLAMVVLEDMADELDSDMVQM